jgi:hypothetical protein
MTFLFLFLSSININFMVCYIMNFTSHRNRKLLKVILYINIDDTTGRMYKKLERCKRSVFIFGGKKITEILKTMRNSIFRKCQ